MTTARKWRVMIGLVLLLVIGLRVGLRLAETEPAESVRLVPDAEIDRDSVDVRNRVRMTNTSVLGAERCRVVVHVEVLPEGNDVEWHAELYVEPTRQRPRARTAHEVRRGSASLTWDVPADHLGLRVSSSEAVGESWTDLDLASGAVREVHVQLRAWGRITGRVQDQGGVPLGGARVVFVPSRQAPGVRGLPPSLNREPMIPETQMTAECGDDGRFELVRVDPRVPYDAAAASPGHAVRREYGVTVAPGAGARQDFVLDLGARVVGRLLDAASLPIADARLEIATASGEGSAVLSWDAEGNALTGVDGRFAFDCLAPGWKKITAVLAAEKGISIVGQWECTVGRGAVHDFGDLIQRDSLFEAAISTPEGVHADSSVTFIFMRAQDLDAEHESSAMLSVPVAADDDGIVRVRGLPAGSIRAIVRAAGEEDTGRWRPKTEFLHLFDGGSMRVDWEVSALVEGAPERVDEYGAAIVHVELELPEAGDGAVAFGFLNGELCSIVRAVGGSVGFEAVEGDRVRLVVTEGDRWGEHELVVEGDARLRPEIRAERPGGVLEVVVQDERRPVPGALVLIGPASAGDDALIPLQPTGADGRLVLRGVPPDVALCVSARVFQSRPQPQTVEWVAGRATVVIDVSEN